MHRNIFLTVIAALCFSCSNDSSFKSAGEKERKMIITSTEMFLKEKLNNPEVRYENDDMIYISDLRMGYRFSPSKIIAGDFDGNKGADAVVPYMIFRGESLMGIEHLILINAGEQYAAVKTMNNILNIIGIRNGKIIAEVSTVSPDSPGFGCNECREVVEYRCAGGDIIRAE